MKRSLLLLNIAIALVSGSTLRGQHVAPISTTGLVKSLTAAPNTDNVTGTQTMIVNRAHVLKDRVDAEGDLYFFRRYSDVAGKPPQDIEALLTPAPVTPQQKVRTMNLVVDIDHPLFIVTSKSSSSSARKTTDGTTPFMIGTTIIDGKVSRDLQVNSFITLDELKITNKRR
jgi:hypothetical protein